MKPTHLLLFAAISVVVSGNALAQGTAHIYFCVNKAIASPNMDETYSINVGPGEQCMYYPKLSMSNWLTVTVKAHELKACSSYQQFYANQSDYPWDYCRRWAGGGDHKLPIFAL